MMGFITNIFNQTGIPAAALNERYRSIADSNAEAYQQSIEGLKRRLELERSKVVGKSSRPPKYSFISWPETKSTGSTETGDLGSEVRVKKIVFQVSLDINHEFSTEVTRYPVEMDSDITDHIINHNSGFSVSAVFSDANAMLIDKEQVTGPISEADVYSELMALRNNKTVVSLSTPLDIYDDLVITNISAPKNADVGRSFQVDIRFEQIRKVSLAIVKNTQKAKGRAVDKTCAPKTDGGAKPVENELPVTGSIFYTPELKQFIDNKWKDLTGVTGP